MRSTEVILKIDFCRLLISLRVYHLLMMFFYLSWLIKAVYTNLLTKDLLKGVRKVIIRELIRLL